MQKKQKDCLRRICMALLIAAICVVIICIFLQVFVAHHDGYYEPENSEAVCCESLLGWAVREDRLVEGADAPELVELQPGDILVTMSTHTFGWRHGHAALVVDEDTTIECAMWGQPSGYGDTEHWNSYSNFAVLRVKNVTSELQEEVVSYAKANLVGVPYHLTSGFIGDKDADTEAFYFGLHCTYLVWYAWNHFGYDLDSDGGRLVSGWDLLCSEEVELVQIYGMESPK